MGPKLIRTIDDLGRVNLPRELRSKLNWEIGTILSLYRKDNTIVLRLENEGLPPGACIMPGVEAGSNCSVCGDCG